MSGPLFGIIPAGLPIITDPTTAPSPTSFLYTIPTAKAFSHIVVLLLPGVTLPSESAASIYLATGPNVLATLDSGGQPNFRFLGAVGPGKESAVFKIGGGGNSEQAVVLGVSVEPAQTVNDQMTQLAANKPSSNVAGGVSSSGDQPSTLVIAQRIIQNAFNFLASFSGQAGQVEVVPLKAFEEWWKKFEGRVRSDPTFLERVQE